jgi:hypothetical protein
VLLLSSIQRPDESPASPQGSEEADALGKKLQKLNLDEAERSRETKEASGTAGESFEPHRKFTSHALTTDGLNNN